MQQKSALRYHRPIPVPEHYERTRGLKNCTQVSYVFDDHEKKSTLSQVLVNRKYASVTVEYLNAGSYVRNKVVDTPGPT